jgi:hypothetical protein
MADQLPNESPQLVRQNADILNNEHSLSDNELSDMAERMRVELADATAAAATITAVQQIRRDN